MSRDRIIVAAALSAAIALVAGTFAAHAATGKAIDWLHTGSHYQLIHAVAAIMLARDPRWRFSAMCILAGANLFALTLYLLALGCPHWVGAITPVGGAAMVIGWLSLAVEEARHRVERN